MIDSTTFANVIEKYRRRKYALGDPSRGIDCANLLFGVYEDLGLILPQEFEGVTRESYADLFRSDPAKASAIFYRFLWSLGRSVEINFSVRGDLMVFKRRNEVFPGISLGGGNVLLVSEFGVLCVPSRAYKDHLVAVRRLL